MKKNGDVRSNNIVVRGASENNLRSIDVDIPREKFVVVSGPSGSGKSSLVFDTIYAEAQRRYMESVSVFARQFFENVRRPEVDSIDGLTPAVAFDQKNIIGSARSTVGTLTDIYAYLRVLFAREGRPFCEKHERTIESSSPQEVADFVLDLPEKSRVTLLAPVVVEKKVRLEDVLEVLIQQGFVRVRVDGELHELGTAVEVPEAPTHSIDVVLDRVVVKSGISSRLSDSIESCLRIGKGFIRVLYQVPDGENIERLFSEGFACPECMELFPKLEPSLFSFNSVVGACPQCQGLGLVDGEDALDGETSRIVCEDCQGSRLRPEALVVRFQERSIAELCEQTIDRSIEFFREAHSASGLSGELSDVMDSLIRLILMRLEFLSSTGLGYLCLSRSADTLTGGEGQRIRISRQIGAELTGMLFVLDEPTMGLHPKDADSVLASLRELVTLGNSLLIVEHSRAAMLESDYIVELGPGAGVNGGEIVAQGTPAEITKSETNTGNYLSGKLQVFRPAEIRTGDLGSLSIRGATHNNLKSLDVDIPIGKLVGICGVSGAGKSSLITNTVFPAAQGKLSRNAKARAGQHTEILGLDHFDRAIAIDQRPIGRSPRSTPATYTGIFDVIRELFAQLPESKVRGYGSSRFSFNVKGGRCEGCRGAGSITHEVQFISEVVLECHACSGKRYNRDTLEINYKGMSIADVLEFTVEEAREFFQRVPTIEVKARVLCDVGLGYLKLGQAAPTLSGGEAQRIKLAVELAKKQTGSTLYLMDEPTSGLHAVDVDVLMRLLHRLVDTGNTVIVVEHSLDVLASCDWLIELGPEGGERGGTLVSEGTPQDLAALVDSPTGVYLKKQIT